MAVVFVDMKREPEKSDDLPVPVMDRAVAPKPYYPYGLNVCLCTEELEKLKIDPEKLQVGGTLHLFSLAKITSISKNDDSPDTGPTYRVELCLEQLATESEDEENEEAEGEKPKTGGMRRMYGRK